jgi:hypothetical protein
MRMRRFAFILVLLAGIACGRSRPAGRYGEYFFDNKQLHLASGEAYPVYRVKYWTFQDGSVFALQLEFEPPFAISDTARLRLLAHKIWPAFGPYVEGLQLNAAILTATNLRRRGPRHAWTATMRHFGFTVRRDSTGQWRLDGHSDPLPSVELDGPPRVLEATGQPLTVDNLRKG